MVKPKTQEEPKKGAPEWMNTYGDMVTLVLTFFVLLFSFSTIDAQKWQQLVAALSGNVGVLDSGTMAIESGESGSDSDISIDDLLGSITQDDSGLKEGSSTETISEEQAQANVAFEDLYGAIREYIQENGLESALGLEKTDVEIRIRFKDNVLFDPGSSDIKQDAYDILLKVEEILGEYHNNYQMARIEGHTDSDPIRTAKFPSNWELSTSRAVMVLRFLIEEGGFDKTKISAVGYGEEHPIAPNDTAENKAKNRRVDFIIVKNIMTTQ